MHADLAGQTDDDGQQVGEELWLVVENGDGLVGRADLAEEVELTHR